jgi:NAD(P)-dependent dehydrogenase (short-subunit alcohol dehydrogenase family)
MRASFDRDQGDISMTNKVQSMIAPITSRLGNIGIWVNNACFAFARRIKEVALALFDEAISANSR